MTHWWVILAAVVVSGAASYLGALVAEHLAKHIVPFEDGPRLGTPPVTMLVGCSGLLGAVTAWHGIGLEGAIIMSVLVWALTACWCCDVRTGIIPDYFTLGPLALVIGTSLFMHQYRPLTAAALVFVPFAITALISRGRGMGWGDVKLATLGGAVLMLPLSFFAFAVACLAAVIVAAIRGRSGEPIAFAPYLAGSIALALSLPAF
jgi:prepilin signal peptidase PulO-like enzyme (type II secretory pathway)